MNKSKKKGIKTTKQRIKIAHKDESELSWPKVVNADNPQKIIKPNLKKLSIIRETRIVWACSQNGYSKTFPIFRFFIEFFHLFGIDKI